MERSRIDGALKVAEASLASGGTVDLAAIGFWKAVNAVKKQPDMVEVFADRIAQVDREAFERWALLRLPSGLGTTLSIVATAGGLILIGWGYRLTGLGQGLALLAGTGVVLVATHGLAHWIVARGQGIKVTHWYVGSLRRPQPGIKVDYATYLRTPARQRAWMHASGAITSKLVPMVALGAGWAMDAPTWALVILALLSVGQLVTDVVWSTKFSDWKKFRREMELAR